MSENNLEEFDKKLKKARGEDPQALEAKRQEELEAESKQGIQVGVELVGAIFLPTIVGYFIDGYFDTRPAFMLILFFLGICTGFYNVYRVTQNMGTAVGVNKSRIEKNDPEK